MAEFPRPKATWLEKSAAKCKFGPRATPCIRDHVMARRDGQHCRLAAYWMSQANEVCRMPSRAGPGRMREARKGQEHGMDEPVQTDVVVIGMGPGGEYAAGALAEAGLDVTAVEDRLVGGECPYYGCVPSKMMVRAANLIAETKRVPGMAGTSAVTPDWSPVARRIREEATDDWNDKVAADRFTGKGGHLVRGRGKVTGAGQVTVASAEGTRVFQARKGIVINTGTDPAIPPLEGLADTPYWTNREIVQAERVPESLIVLGGGAIGAELAQVFARFGAAVTMVEALPRLLSFEEPEASELIERVFANEGIT